MSDGGCSSTPGIVASRNCGRLVLFWMSRCARRRKRSDVCLSASSGRAAGALRRVDIADPTNQLRLRLGGGISEHAMKFGGELIADRHQLRTKIISRRRRLYCGAD